MTRLLLFTYPHPGSKIAAAYSNLFDQKSLLEQNPTSTNPVRTDTDTRKSDTVVHVLINNVVLWAGPRCVFSPKAVFGLRDCKAEVDDI